MALLFNSFQDWKNHCESNQLALYIPVMEYEIALKGKSENDIWNGMAKAYTVMKEAIQTGLTADMTSRSGMVNNTGKKVNNTTKTVLNKEFQTLIATTIAAKEVNSCMGRIVAAPTAGASGIIPGILANLQNIHQLDEQKILEGLLVAAGIGLIIQQNASIAGAIGGCQAETGSAAAMGAGAIVYCLDGNISQIFNAVAITIQCTLGLVCDPVAGLVEVPCIVRNASAVAIAYTAAQIAIANGDAVIPVDECVVAMGEVGQSMESKYKETALGGLAATLTAKEISKKVHGTRKD